MILWKVKWPLIRNKINGHFESPGWGLFWGFTYPLGFFDSIKGPPWPLQGFAPKNIQTSPKSFLQKKHCSKKCCTLLSMKYYKYWLFNNGILMSWLINKKTYNWVGNFIPNKSHNQPGTLFSFLINLDLNKNCNFTQSRSVWKICDP